MSNQVNEIYEKMVKGVEEVLSSEKWQEYLNLQGKFHRYTFSNVMLILFQFPEAKRVAGFKTWNSLGRFVKKGETGIKILAPRFIKKEIEKDGQVEPEVKKMLKGFMVVSVFDISQTDGKPLSNMCEELAGASDEANILFDKLVQVVEIKHSEGNTGTAKGWYNTKTKEIMLSNKVDLNHKVKTFCHEYTHHIVFTSGQDFIRQDHEIIAESVAYIVCNKFGLDTSSYSFEYVASWAGDAAKVQKIGEVIQKTAGYLLDKIDGLNVVNQKAS